MTVDINAFITGDSVYVDGTEYIVGDPVHISVTTSVPTDPTENIGDKFFVYHQTIPIATWTINHTFGRLPSVTVIGPDGFVIFTDVEYPNNAMVVLTFAEPTSGRALLV